MPLDEEAKAEVAAIAAESVKTALVVFGDEQDKARKGLAASLTKSIEKTVSAALEGFKSEPPPDPPNDPGNGDDLATKALEAKVAKLEAAAVQRDKDAAEREAESRRQSISQRALEQITEAKTLRPKTLRDLIVARNQGRLELGNDGELYVKNGDDVMPFSDHLSEFLDSEDGALFKPAPSKAGSGLLDPGDAPKPGEKPNLNKALAGALGTFAKTGSVQ